ncbi:hypothetical protein F5Y17DRAFT_434922 [Xylariaceae sp. FL0594]|nr:hypothetical protein F5Y17DRAFT_434922 [Xylariaceae sp. FL0594]
MDSMAPGIGRVQPQAAHAANVSRAGAIAKLDACGAVDHVIELMNPSGSRFFGWNFQAIKKYKTVEFRRGLPAPPLGTFSTGSS